MHPWIAAIFGNVKATVMLRALRRLGLASLIPYLAGKKMLEARIKNAQFAEDRMRSRVSMGTNCGDFLDPCSRNRRKKVVSLSMS